MKTCLQGNKVRRTFITAGMQDFYCLSFLVLLIRAEGDGVRKIAGEVLSGNIPPGESRFMEKEQLKVCTKTPGLNFQNIQCIKSAWHRLMTLEGLEG